MSARADRHRHVGANGWSRRLRSGGGRTRAHAFVSLEDQTPARRFFYSSAPERKHQAHEQPQQAPPPPLGAGEALYVDVSALSAPVAECPGEGDFVVEIAASILR
jgi:hypothetical protein